MNPARCRAHGQTSRGVLSLCRGNMKWLSRPKQSKPPPLPISMYTRHTDDSDDEDESMCTSDEMQVLVDKTVGPCDYPGQWDHSDDFRQHSFRHNTSTQARPWHKQPRYAGLLRSTIVSVSVLLLLAAFSGYWIVQLLLIRHAAYRHSVMALPIIPDGKPVEHLVQPLETGATPEKATNTAMNVQGRSATLRGIQQELDRRFTSINAPLSTMTCHWSAGDQDRYKALAGQGPYLFALNLFNNQQVIPTLAQTLLQLSQFLGNDNVFISIFENGSTDNTTLALAHTAAALSAADVAHEILSDPRKTDWRYVDRIAQLALYRNYALRPVNSTMPARQPLATGVDAPRRSFEHVVFINDVFLCPKDVLELVYQRTSQRAHAACAMDWRNAKPWFGKWFGSKNNIKFYDNWVARTLSGNLFRARVDLLAEFRDGLAELVDQRPDEPTHRRLKHGLPMPVYSCWNGVIALPAAPFQASASSINSDSTSLDTNFRRATTLEPVHFRSTLNTPEICPGASECKIMARDFWSRGLNRWLVIPTVHVTYEREVYDHPALTALAQRGQLAANASMSGLSEMVDWAALRPPESVACYPWFRGTKIEVDEIRAPPF